MGALDVERRQQIVALVDHENSVTVADLSKRLGVSAATIRRDLIQLSQRGLIVRAHGGAARRLNIESNLMEPPLLKRAALQAEEKRRIGAAAAAHVGDHETVIIASGTTTSQMIPHLAERQGLTVLTNSLNIATLLAPYPAVEVILLGGVLRHSELTTLGSIAETTLENLRADKLFIGCSAIHIDYGISAENVAEAHCDRLFMSSAGEVTVLADHTKFGKVSLVRVALIDRVRRLITDHCTPEDDLSALRDQNVLVEIA
jgi:DeoR/GlpR family transcriptional regulator of sugar metabolism